jgi:hypothetical protein
MGRRSIPKRGRKEKNAHLDGAYYDKLYANEELTPSLFRISPATERGVNRTWEI